MRLFEQISLGCGRLVSWLCLAMVIALTLNVLSSWLFNYSSILISESITWMHAANFLLAVGYTLNRNEHVRVDIFYARMSVRQKALVDLIGTLLFLFPVAIFIIWASWPHVTLSWRISEASAEAGGMPALYMLKSLLLVMPCLLMVEGVNQVLQNIALLRGKMPNPIDSDKVD